MDGVNVGHVHAFGKAREEKKSCLYIRNPKRTEAGRRVPNDVMAGDWREESINSLCSFMTLSSYFLLFFIFVLSRPCGGGGISRLLAGFIYFFPIFSLALYLSPS